MNSINLSAVINQREFDFDKVSSTHYESEQKPYDTAIITFTDTQLRARVTDDVENHVFLFSIFRWAEPTIRPTRTDAWNTLKRSISSTAPSPSSKRPRGIRSRRFAP